MSAIRTGRLLASTAIVLLLSATAPGRVLAEQPDGATTATQSAPADSAEVSSDKVDADKADSPKIDTDRVAADPEQSTGSIPAAKVEALAAPAQYKSPETAAAPLESPV